jgi:hypothetical protein
MNDNAQATVQTVLLVQDSAIELLVLTDKAKLSLAALLAAPELSRDNVLLKLKLSIGSWGF